MRCVELDRFHRMRCFFADAGRLHEVEGVRDAVGQLAVLFRLGGRGKAKGPGVDLVHIGITTGRKGT